MHFTTWTLAHCCIKKQVACLFSSPRIDRIAIAVIGGGGGGEREGPEFTFDQIKHLEVSPCECYWQCDYNCTPLCKNDLFSMILESYSLVAFADISIQKPVHHQGASHLVGMKPAGW